MLNVRRRINEFIMDRKSWLISFWDEDIFLINRLIKKRKGVNLHRFYVKKEADSKSASVSTKFLDVFLYGFELPVLFRLK